MTFMTAAGTALLVSRAHPSAYTIAAYRSVLDAATPVGEVQGIGEIGKSYNVASFTPLHGRGEKKGKGAYNHGSISPVIACDRSDAGQNILRAALDSDSPISCFARLSDGSAYAFEAYVSECRVAINETDSLVMLMPTLEITDSQIVWIPTPAPPIVVIAPPSIIPATALAGEPVQIRPGNYTGADTINRVLTLNGVNVTAQMTGNSYTPEQPGNLIWTETATNAEYTVTRAASTLIRLPKITVTNGIITTFTRSGIKYTQILMRTSGALVVSDPVPGARWALIGGGASGGFIGRSGGGGGASTPAQGSGALDAGLYDITVGAGGAAVTGNAQGNPGSPSTILRNSASWLVSPGGGNGGSNGNGGAGACGGGAGSNGTSRVGGVGSPGFNGGDSVNDGSSANEAGGGGGGAGGPGQNGVGSPAPVGGKGGLGVTLAFCEPPIDCCGGGGGNVSGATGGTPGTATHGGTAASRAASANAINGSGSGAGVTGTGNGGNGFFALVFPSANATAEAA